MLPALGNFTKNKIWTYEPQIVEATQSAALTIRTDYPRRKAFGREAESDQLIRADRVIIVFWHFVVDSPSLGMKVLIVHRSSLTPFLAELVKQGFRQSRRG